MTRSDRSTPTNLGTNADYASPVRLALAKQSRPDSVSMAIVLPVYNERSSIGPFLDAMAPTEEALANNQCHVRYIFVNDGSQDDTLEQLVQTQALRDDIDVLDLSRNFGKEAALTAGIAAAVEAGADTIVPIDVDLQDPPALIPEMLTKWREGYQVVLARRIDRSSDNQLKAWSALAFYRLFNMMSRDKIPENVGDFRLIDRSVAQAIGHLQERGRMMKALMTWVGFSRAYVDFHRQSRAAGRTTFNARALLRLGIGGIIAFSTAPLRAILVLGLAVSAAAFGYAIFVALRTTFFGVDVPGYASTLVIILFAAALQLTTLGVVGEYIARLFQEVKARPAYLIGQKIDHRLAQKVQADATAGGKHSNHDEL